MALLVLVTCLSGFAALVYQMLWIRELALVLGSTTASICTVVAAFMGGLALGSGVFGKLADRRERALGLYAALEVGIGVAALAVLVALPRLSSVYPALASAAARWPGALALARFAVAFALLLAPTSLMGGTFPVLVKAATRDLGRLGGTVGRLYGANTLGAVAGCLAAGVWMIGALGLRSTCFVAVALNLACALAAGLFAIAQARRARPKAALATQIANLPSRAGASASSRGSAIQGDPSTRGSAVERRSPARAIRWAVALSGCVALGYEIVWSRALAIVLGHSIYAFTFVLSTYLAGLAIGGLLAAPWLDRSKQPMRTFAAGLLLLGVAAGASVLLVPLLPFREYRLGVEPLAYVAANLGCTAVLLLPPTLLLGALLPLAIRIGADDLARAGDDVGRIYAWNTVGSIAGSLLTGFALIPSLGTQTSLFVLALANLALALAIGVRASWPRTWLAAAGLAILLAAVGVASSRGSPILRRKAVERVERELGGPVELEFFGEDQVTSVGLVRGANGLERLFTNGVLMTHWGIETLWMAHLPLAVVDEPRDVLVLCLGMGNTFRAAARHPVSVTAVELSPKVVEAFGALHPNEPPQESDDRIEVGDARNAVLVSERSFDVITIDPPPPLYSAGTVNFHTREFFELCRARIRPGGVVCEWIPFNDCTPEEFQSIARTFASVFERASLWVPVPAVSGAYLLGLGPRAKLDEDEVRRRMRTPLVEADARAFSALPLEELLPRVVLRDGQLAEYCGDAPLLEDERPFLEFPLLRNRGRTELMSWKPLLEHLRARGLAK